jgi:teichuronic acid biosynthesis glycosyltransferase TuaG
MPDYDENRKVPVSVIIPCYNCRETIHSTVESIIKQTKLPEEIILINDASPDNGKTSAVLQILKDRLAGIINIHVINFAENKGPACARNAGWDLASQPYVAFLDADDIWHPQKLEIVYDIIERNPSIDLIGHDFYLVEDRQDAAKVYSIEDKRKIIKKSFFPILLLNPFVTPSFFLKKNIRQRMNPHLRFCEDHEFLLRVAHSYNVYHLKLKLVQLGRKPFSQGGLTAKRLLMRKGEITMYLEALRYRRILFFSLPLLILFSMVKHVVLLGLLYLQRKTVIND